MMSTLVRSGIPAVDYTLEAGDSCKSTVFSQVEGLIENCTFTAMRSFTEIFKKSSSFDY